MLGADRLLSSIRAIREKIRAEVIFACESSCANLTSLSRVVEDGEGDTVFSVDRIAEGMMVGLFEREVASYDPILLIAEGVTGGKITLPRGRKESEAVWRVIADPIDGTRSLMYQKRAASILTRCIQSR